MNNLHDVLETCLDELENGADLERILVRYPDLADELRPILVMSVNAKRMAVSPPSADVVRRNRAKVLQRAAVLRQDMPRPFVRWPSRQRWALAFVLLFFFTGANVVRASSNSLPGDTLYGVKRSWEDLTLSITLDEQEHEVLEVEYENERLEELHELFASGRTTYVDFAGIVSKVDSERWWVSNVLVIVSDQASLPAQPIQAGAAVRVYGTTRSDGIVVAERIELLPVGAALPEVKDVEPAIEGPPVTTQPENDNSGPGPNQGSGNQNTNGGEDDNVNGNHNDNGVENDNPDNDNNNNSGNMNDDTSDNSGSDNDGTTDSSGNGNDGTSDNSGSGNDHIQEDGDNRNDNGDGD